MKRVTEQVEIGRGLIDQPNREKGRGRKIRWENKWTFRKDKWKVRQNVIMFIYAISHPTQVVNLLPGSEAPSERGFMATSL